MDKLTFDQSCGYKIDINENQTGSETYHYAIFYDRLIIVLREADGSFALMGSDEIFYEENFTKISKPEECHAKSEKFCESHRRTYAFFRRLR